MGQVPLDLRFLSESDAARLYQVHKELGRDPDEYCPTCAKEGFYYWPNKETRIECDCRKQLQYYKHYLNAGIGSLYQRLSWLDYQGNDELIQLADNYVANAQKFVAQGIGIVLMGDIGTGKTLFANLLLKDLLHEGYSVYSVTFAGMIDMFTAGWTSETEKQFFLERIRKSEILLIDDIGKEYKTKNGLGSATFDSVLRSRVQEGRPTFITTNMTPDDMEDGYGSAVLSLINEISITHEVEGNDFRSTAGKRKMTEIRDGLTRPIV